MELELSLSPRGCTLLLYSISQLLQAITVKPTAPHTQSRFYITSIRRCTNAENIWRQPCELCVSSGAGRASSSGGSLQPAHCASVPWAGQQWHHEGRWSLSPSHSHHLLYKPHSGMFTGAFTKLSVTAFRCERRWQMYVFWCMWDVANHLNVHL